ncbi:sperm-associated antigen 7 [Leptinotarsa decemlineata]|uniref:sperm-associated antigen 7 n=1 Tax=Leptinotarsa decemlineata TaxID=7539 RepID=UPI000C254C21|nr:sperm-associated antigen 7 homolog [Leptinotarsa decemlineata]
MDLLGSIMNAMDKPPSLTEKEKILKKKRKEEFERRQTEEKEKLQRFKDRVEAKLISHFKDPKNVMLKFEPMDQICRSIVHELAESCGLLSYAFGTDGVDRYVRIYSKEHPPCEDEIAARRKGEPWNEEIRRQLMEKRHQAELEIHGTKRKSEKFTPNSNYKDKYAHIIGQDAALEAARKTETNKSYGFVPSENKKDMRSIEQTMADIRAKKRQKLEKTNLQDDSSDVPSN